MTSITSSDSREVWLSGTETIRMVHELVGIEKDPQAREVGRTTRMAVKLAHIALSVPDHKVIVKDHFESEEADHALVRKVAKILDALGVSYELGQDPPDRAYRLSFWIRVVPWRPRERYNYSPEWHY